LKKRLLIFLFAFASVVCSAQTTKFPVFIDTFAIKGKEKIVTKMEMRERLVQYLGPYKDTITFQRLQLTNQQIDSSHKLLMIDDLEKPYADYNNSKLKISIDPAKQVTLEEYEWGNKQSRYQYYKAYPILITNTSDSIIIVGHNSNVPLELEALDKNKAWQPVEKHFMHLCGTGMKYILIKPKEILCVLAPVYKGDFKTKLRYRLGDSYSRTFIGYVSSKQFIETSDPF
jgi:hypothetical protein